MSGKWNEKWVINFLKVYREYPCLWNPYHKDYYNCYEKDHAFKKIIDYQDTPGLTVTDYLNQIKIIREKYKEEQARTFNSLQNKKEYKSPFLWYNIIAHMLVKVIDDEKKVKQRDGYSIFRSLSSDNINNSQENEKIPKETKLLGIRPCDNTTCAQSFRRSKSAEKAFRLNGKTNSTKITATKEKSDRKVRCVLCPQYMTSLDRSKDQEVNAILNRSPIGDTESKAHECPTSVPCDSMNYKFNALPSLARKCVKSSGPTFLKCPSCGWEDLKFKDEKNAESNTTSCSMRSKNIIGDMYTSCPECDNVTRDTEHSKKRPFELLYGQEYCGDFEVLQDLSKRSSSDDSPKEKCINAAVQCNENPQVVSKGKVDTAVQLQAKVIQDEPIKASRSNNGTIEASTQFKIILPNLYTLNSVANPTKNASEIPESVQRTSSRSCAKRTQFSFKDVSTESSKTDRNVNTGLGVDRQVQTSIDLSSDGKKSCVRTQTVHQTNEEKKTKDECCGAGSTISKDVSVNVVDQASKGMQCTIGISCGNLTRPLSSERMVEVATNTSSHQIRSVCCMTKEHVKEFKSEYVQCTAMEESLSSNEENDHSLAKCYTEDGDPKYHLKEDIAAQYFDNPCTRDTCPLNILNLINENPVMAIMVWQLLQNILSSNKTAQPTISDRQIQQGGELKENCSINPVEVTVALNEYISKLLGSNISEDNVKDLNKKLIDAAVPTSTETKLNLATTAASTAEKQQDASKASNDKTPIMEKSSKELRVGNKEVCACSNKKSIGNDAPPIQTFYRNTETQSCAQLKKDSVCARKYEKEVLNMVSIGTQKRDPIIVRLIKCTGSQAIQRSDKEVSTLRELSCVDDEQKIDRPAETCNRQTCVSGKSREINLGSTLNINYHDKEATNYCKRYVTFKDDICDKNCRGKLSYDWINVMNSAKVANISTSKIPMGISPQRCAYARNK